MRLRNRLPSRLPCLLGLLLLFGCTPTASPPSVAVVATGTDLAWTHLMIALNEKVLTVLDLVPTRHSDLAALSAELAAQHRGELVHLRNLLKASGVPDDKPHEGHEMPGMVSAAAFASLAKASGPDFDRLLVPVLRTHLDQCVLLAAGELTSGIDPATLALARSIAEIRPRQLARLPAQQ